MAILIDATVATETANSYCDVDYADDYFDRHYNSVKKAAWAALSDEAKEEALIQATLIIEQFRFTIDTTMPSVSDLRYDPRRNRFVSYATADTSPQRYNYYQALQFPRSLDVYTDGSYYIPEKIKRAACEQAVFLQSFDETALANRLSGITMDRVSIGGGQISATQEYGLGGTMLAPMAHQMIRPYLISSTRIRRG